MMNLMMSLLVQTRIELLPLSKETKEAKQLQDS